MAISVAYLHLCITTRRARCRVSPEAAASVGAVRRSNQPTKVAPHTTAASLSLLYPDTVSRVIAYRRRQNGRSNQSAQRQNPGQPGRGLLLLNPLVVTRERGGIPLARGGALCERMFVRFGAWRVGYQWLGGEEVLREHWLTMASTIQTSGARPPTSVSPLRPSWTPRKTPRCTSRESTRRGFVAHARCIPEGRTGQRS